MSLLSDPSLLRAHAFVDGAWVAAADGARFAVTNPADGSVLGHVPAMGAAETRAAVDAAARALPGWRERTAKDRSRLMRRWFDLISEAADDLARLLTLEQGKPLAEAKGEVAYGAAFVEWYAEEAKRVYGEVIPEHGPGKRIVVTREPVGVVAAITPWNFPVAMVTRKCAPALAAGCTVVVKPAEDTPLSALALAALAERAGLPPGVFNVVTAGDPRAVGGELTANPTVRKLSFTGSTEVGRLLLAQWAPTVKKVSLELGGNAPFIVFDDADLDQAVAGAMASKYRNAGQTCVCANRLLVQDGIHDRFAEALACAVAGLSVGPGLDGVSQQGPLINAAAVEKVEAHVADALAKGARLVCGGKRHALGGTFFEPPVLAGVTPAMLSAREEVFGPVAPLFRFSTEAEAVAMANDTEYGLAAYVYTRDSGRSWRVARALDYGIVGINDGLISTEAAPFGGMKQSGLGRVGGRQGLEEFLETKYLFIGGV